MPCILILITVLILYVHIDLSFRYNKVISYLKLKHLDKWIELGRPSTNSHTTIESRMGCINLRKFVKARHDKNMNDQHLELLCNAIRQLAPRATIIGIVSIVSMILLNFI